MGLPNTTHRLLSKQLCAFTNPGALAWCEIGLACLGVAREGRFYPHQHSARQQSLARKIHSERDAVSRIRTALLHNLERH